MKQDKKYSPLHFIDIKSNKIIKDFISLLKKGYWNFFDYESFVFNESLPPDKINLQRPLFKNIQQIIPGNQWNFETKQLEQNLYTPKRVRHTFDEFISISNDFFNSLNAKRIGVHLSGGLDSGIVICLLNYLNIPFVPIGIQVKSYEFRTERYIQDKLVVLGKDGLLIDYDETPFYKDIDKIPIHAIPTGIIQSYLINERLSSEFKKLDCDVVISGQGGDSLFVDGCHNLSDLVFNIGNEFVLEDARNISYNPKGIELISFYSHIPIINIISSAREGKHDDPLKIWARKWCKPILPKELSDYTYIGDFFALGMRGLNEAKPTIKKIFEKAFEISHIECFNPKNTKKYLSTDVFNFEVQDYWQFCSSLSLAVWYNSLSNEKSTDKISYR